MHADIVVVSVLGFQHKAIYLVVSLLSSQKGRNRLNKVRNYKISLINARVELGDRDALSACAASEPLHGRIKRCGHSTRTIIGPMLPIVVDYIMLSDILSIILSSYDPCKHPLPASPAIIIGLMKAS